MSVGSWEPAAAAELTPADVERLCRAAARLDAENFGLEAEEIARLAPLLRHEGAIDWGAAVEGLSSEAIEALIRLFTLGEMKFSAWEAGARSPVVPLAALLKARGDYPPELTRWIKSHTSNRFLPHGSLLDRL